MGWPRAPLLAIAITAAAAPTVAAGEAMLSKRYLGDVGLADEGAVLFADDFEAGWGRWDAPLEDTEMLVLENDAARAHSGSGYLRSTVTRSQLKAAGSASSSASHRFHQRVDRLYFRFYARFPEVAPHPHHWVRFEAGDDQYAGSGRANTVPRGDKGFWFAFDARDDGQFQFYVYWHEMRSGRCNDGSATPGCAGDQGTTYYYGNVFRPAAQRPVPRDRWLCVEVHAQANEPGRSDGRLAFWIDDRLVGDYGPARPEGTWLRGTFHEGGCAYPSCGPPEPFTGFNFRTSPRVGFKRIILAAYYQYDTTLRRADLLATRGLDVSDEQTVLYDDIVAATERIGCRRPAASREGH